jgi:monovalent cation/hydrogen antiporter
MALVELVLLLVAACIAFAVIARRSALPYAVILVLGGMALALIPGLPTVRLDPELALAFFLPPLLQGSAFRTDWRAFRFNLRPILLLAIGAVLFTAFCVAVVAKLLIPDLPWAAAIALGAIVAPPDAVAAASVLQRLRLPRRIVTVLEGESLLNDASSLVLYRLAVAAVAAGALAPGEAAASFALVGVGGLVVGYIVARVATWAIALLDDPLLETALSFLVGYASFLAAEAVHVSGVIAVVTTGMIIGQSQHRVLSAQTRIFAGAVWEFILFILNGLVFILIGLQLNGVLDRLGGRGWLELTGIALAVSAVLIVSRFVWVFPSAHLQRAWPGVRATDPTPPTSHLVVIAWAGMRGVVSLAAALALPLDFPERDLLVFLAFCAILATLVVQGTTLEWVIRRLGVTEPAPRDGIEPEEAAARHLAAEAALREIQSRVDDPLEGAIAADLLAEFRDRAGHLLRTASGNAAAVAERAARRRLRFAAGEAARARLVALHRETSMSDELLGKLIGEVDLEEIRVRQVLGVEQVAPRPTQRARPALVRRFRDLTARWRLRKTA